MTALDEALRILSDSGTSTVSDALDRLGIDGQCRGISALSRGFRLAGRAFTVRYSTQGTDGGTVGDYVDDVGAGDVVVLDNQGRTDVTVWGDLLTLVAHRNSVGGTVIDGVCRDSERALQLDYPIFSRGNWMRTGKDRVRVDEVQGPVSIGGVRVVPGDLVLGDPDGVVCVPASARDEVVGVVATIALAEERIRELVDEGRTLREARTEVGYHQLQRRQE